MNKQEHTSYFKSLSILTIILAVITLGVQLSPWSNYLNSYSWLVFIYMVLLSLVSYFLRYKGFKSSDPYDTYNYSMLATTVRLLVSAVVLAIYCFLVKKNLGSFTFIFFVYYFIYTAFEIKSLLPKLRTVSEKK
jgi:hypothetical protein